MTELIPLPGWCTTPYRHSDGSVWYIVQLESGETRKFHIDEVCVLPYLSYDGYTGISLLSAAQEALGTDQAAQAYAGKFYANGARPSGVIEAPNKADEASKTKIRESFERMNAGMDNAFRVAIFDMGMKYTISKLALEVISMTAEQLEREQNYRVAMALARILLRDGVINGNELRVIDTIMLAKFQPIITGLYPENILIQSRTRGNV